MAITSEFSLQNTTVEIFDNSTSTQQTALNTLRTSLKTASTEALRVSAFNTFLAASGTVTATASITVTGGATTPAAQVEGYYTGAFTIAGGIAGTWYSTSSTLTAVTAVLVPTSGALAAGSGSLATVYTTSTNVPASTVSGTYTATTATGSGALISKITAIGDTGKTYAIVSAKLVSESGTIKAKGSSDEGDLTIDYIAIPSDSGQALMELAFDDQSINGNRVFKITHTSSGAAVYCVGMVTELKKTRGSVDNFASVKAKVTLQDGLAEYNPA